MPSRGRQLFGYQIAGSARVGGEVPQLGKAVLYRQHRSGIVEMDNRLERERRENCSIDVGIAESRMFGMTCPPHSVQNRRLLRPVLLKPPSKISPLVILTFAAFHKVKALIGPPE